MIKRSFISGRLDLEQKEFDENYKEQINEAVKRNDHFVIDDCKGIRFNSTTIPCITQHL